MKKLTPFLTVPLLVIFAVAFSGCATLPIVAEGTTANESIDDIQFIPIAADRCMVEIDGVLIFTGTIDGRARMHTVDIIEGPCDQIEGPGVFDGNATSRGTFFEGTVNGVEGTFDLIGRWSVDAGGQNYQGEIVIVKGYGELAGLQGMVTETSDNIFDTQYSGRLHFDLTQ